VRTSVHARDSAAKLLRISEAAERLNVSRASVYRWIAEGAFPLCSSATAVLRSAFP
jgi:predicted DNA-binding transcriptional regulator AlpA